MEIESERLIGLEKRNRDRGELWHGHKTISLLLTLPVKALNWLPLLTVAARAEARRISITRKEIEIHRLPSAFDGVTVAFLTDLHCSKLTPPDFVEQVIAETNGLKPDLILLGGDYVTKGTAYIRPVAKLLAQLRAPLGVYGVLGNHDYWDDPRTVRLALKEAGVVDITNSGRWLTRGGSRLRLAGVADLWEDKPDLRAALAGVREDEVAILLSHDPDFAMGLKDKRVGFVLSGHTHGGQICLPVLGPVITNSQYGKRLVSGLVRFDGFHLYTSRGIGTVLVPMRYGCPPEIALFTLRSKGELRLRAAVGT